MCFCRKVGGSKGRPLSRKKLRVLDDFHLLIIPRPTRLAQRRLRAPGAVALKLPPPYSLRSLFMTMALTIATPPRVAVALRYSKAATEDLHPVLHALLV